MSDSDRSPTSPLVDYLETRIAEDEERWTLDLGQFRSVVYVPGADGTEESVGIERAAGSPKAWARVFAGDDGKVDNGWHVHDSALEVLSRAVIERNLAECKAKRAIIAQWRSAATELDRSVKETTGVLRGNLRHEVAAAAFTALDTVVGRLAAMYADVEEARP